MKLRDAERCGKASQAMIDRVHSSMEKLLAKEEAILKLLETLPTVNEQLEGEFGKWSTLMEDLDPDAELSQSLLSAPAFDLDEIRSTIEGAFLDARTALESEIDPYEEVVTAAAEYVEPEEEEEEADEPVAWICNAAGCGAESPEADTPEEADAAAEAAGWAVDSEHAWCPKHAESS